MAEGAIGRSQPMVGAAGVAARTGSATDGEAKRDPRDRRREDEPNRRRRRLFDLLFEEFDQVDGLTETQRSRIRKNIRARIAAKVLDSQIRATQQAAHAQEIAAQRGSPPPSIDSHGANAPADSHGAGAPADSHGAGAPALGEPLVTADPERILSFVAPEDPDLPPDELIENARLAAMLRDCLSRNTDRARKVATYLHLILALDGAMRPHVVVDV